MSVSQKSFDLLIKGFKSESQVKEFIAWYEGQGEQDASLWFEEARSQGKIGVDSMNMDMKAGVAQTASGFSITVNPR